MMYYATKDKFGRYQSIHFSDDTAQAEADEYDAKYGYGHSVVEVTITECAHKENYQNTEVEK